MVQAGGAGWEEVHHGAGWREELTSTKPKHPKSMQSVDKGRQVWVVHSKLSRHLATSMQVSWDSVLGETVTQVLTIECLARQSENCD